MAESAEAVNLGPGYFIRRYMDEYGWMQTDLAEVMEVSTKMVNYLINEKQHITPEISIVLGRVFNTSSEFWMNLEIESQLREMKNVSSDRSESISLRAEMHRIMPVAEMKRKGWFLSDVKTAADVKAEYVRLFGQNSIPSGFYEGLNKFCARQTKYDNEYTNRYCRIWYMFAKMHAERISLPPYNRDGLNVIANSLSSYTSMEDGITKVIAALHDTGVGFFMLSHLEKTYLDGASFLIEDGRPFIVYTGRYDRTDNFWFVLAHEIAHILKHFELLAEPRFDSFGSSGLSDVEDEADVSAEEYLHKRKVVELGMRYGKYLSESRLKMLSLEAGVSSSVAIGMLCNSGILEWRRFARFKETVRDKIPMNLIMG